MVILLVAFLGAISAGCVEESHSGGTGGDAAGTGGASTGSGGQSGTGGKIGGTGGGAGAAAGMGGHAGGSSPGAGGGGGAAMLVCPGDATFCSGFEQPGLPAGAVYKANAAPGDWSRDFAQDTTVHNGGAASLRVKSSSEAGTSGSAYKMLAVPAPPGGKFWVRFFVRSELDLGGVDHNAFVEAAGSDDPNESVSLELAEDVGIAFNFHDGDRWPAGFGRTSTGGLVPFTLAKNTWHCVEISFDSQTPAQMLFIDGASQISVTGYPSPADLTKPFSAFRFGFVQFHGPPRQVWYDDVTVGPTRGGCP